LQSTAPALIYEEGNLIKRAIRDLYSRDIEDVHVSGEEGFKAARDFMKMLMPSHAKKVQEYKNNRIPMFHKFGVENQIFEMGEPVVNLKSGGYLVINPTEALVSVDVNSGRATKERHIEDTALKTNLEAADEVARQLRLRDLGGLVVIDFIDMEDRRNNRKVEQRLRDALSSDRARIQVGRISSFGLLELSRQRLNPSLAEAQQEICQHCAGTGRVKTLDFSAISVIRALEVEGIKGKNTDIVVTMAPSVVLYIMNNKRRLLADIEARYGFSVSFVTDETLSTSQYKLETIARTAPKISEGISSVAMDETAEDVSEEEIEESEGEEISAEEQGGRPRRSQGDQEEGHGRRRRGRRGGRGRGRDRDRTPRENGEAALEESTGNRIESEDYPADDIGNRAEGEEAGDDNRGNREPREGQRRGGRGRGRGGRGERGDRNNRGPREGNRERPLREDQPPRVEPQVHAAAPIQVVARPSNDAPPEPKAYENVNQAPEKKKKGWWNKLVE
jgi:ribonuclease E